MDLQVLHDASRGLLQSSGHLTGTDEYFVTVAPDGSFALNCQKIFIAGWNQYVLSLVHLIRVPNAFREHPNNDIPAQVYPLDVD